MGARCRMAERDPPRPRIRSASAADVARIVEIERASFADPWSRESFAALLANPNVCFRVASVDPPGDAHRSGVVGYVVAWLVVDEAEIANLAVEPAARRSGAGRLLLDSALGEAAARGVRTVYLEVRESNEAARSLYASRGFDEVGRRRAYYTHPREDALVLRRRLVSGDLSGGMERAQRK